VGKQTLQPSHIFYRSCSGIWQQVWIEPAPEDHINQLDVVASADGEVTVTVHSASGEGGSVEVTVVGSDGSSVAVGTGNADEEFTFTVDGPELWWPDSPNLYNLTVTLGDDEVLSYTGFRTISIGEVEGVTRHLLNGEFVFQFGTLDQGYWPDGLHTPPNREAMEFDIKALKDFGFNMLRKHVSSYHYPAPPRLCT
jgi:beta-galactosidase/beta-glucuronidase